MKYLGSMKEELVRKTRYSTYMVVSIWKILFFFGSTVLLIFMKGDNVTNFFTLLRPSLQPHNIVVSEVNLIRLVPPPPKF